MQTTPLAFLALAMTIASTACEAAKDNNGSAPRVDAKAEQPALAPPSHETEKSGECPASESGQGAPHGCECGAESPGNERIEISRDPVTGQPMQTVGAKLGTATRVSVVDLVSHPDAHAGRTVRIEGDITAMCHHRRAWFAVQDPKDRSGTFVRVMAAPAFLVPPGSIGKRARTEGVVEIRDVPAPTSRHLAQEHGLGGPREAAKQVILRATGAEII